MQSAKIIPYQVKARLFPSSFGPENELSMTAANAKLFSFVHQRRRLGLEVSESIIHASLHVEGVRKVVLQDWVDIVATPYEAPYCTSIELAWGVE